MKYSLTGVFWVSSGASYLSDMLINSQWIGLELTTYIYKKKKIQPLSHLVNIQRLRP